MGRHQMTGSLQSFRRPLWPSVILAAALGQYLLFPRFFNIEPDLQHRLATVLGAVSLSGGCVGIGIGLSSRKIANRRKWIALIVGPLGATQVCTGLTLLFW